MGYSRKMFDSSISEQTKTTAINNSGSAIANGTPVGIDSLGGLQLINVSNEASVKAFVGVVSASISNGASGDIITSGRMENVTTSFAIGDVVYISKTGGITNQAPESGVNSFVSGDFAIKLGIIMKNRTNPLNKDFLVSPLNLGQLA